MYNFKGDYMQENLWEETLSVINKSINKESFQMWFEPTTFLSLNEQELRVGVPTDFSKNYLEKHYKNVLEDTIKRLKNNKISINFIISPKEVNKEGERKESPKSLSKSNYSFSNFVVGESNRFAHAASHAVAQAPASIYNPLFIYGGAGLGKTHLIHAIGHYIKKNLQLMVKYIPLEQFMNEFINSIHSGKAINFKNKYRNTDCLLVDDIQFISGKEGTQDEFFHTFNTLYNSGRQIVLSSDRPPKEISTLEERLSSRFESGLIVDIQPPNFETRVAILKKKAEGFKIKIDDDILYFIATQIKSNIRKLEGALTRVVAYSSLENTKIDINLVKKMIMDISTENIVKSISILSIQERVASHFNLKTSDLKAKIRSANIAFPRQIAMFLSRELTHYSLPEIAKEFGGRNHTTVLHAYKKITHEMVNNQILKNNIERIKEVIV